MVNKVFAIRDVLNGYGAPMLDHSDATASRNFKYAISSNPSIGFKPSDYELYCIGEYDSDTGSMIPLPSPILIMRGVKVE